MCATAHSADRSTARHFLDEVSEIFVLVYGDVNLIPSDRGEQSFKLFQPILRERLLSYSSVEYPKNNYRTKKAITDIRDIAVRNFEKIFMRGEGLERLMERVDNLVPVDSSPNRFSASSPDISHRWSYNMLICILVVLGTILYIIYVFTYK